MTDQLFLGTLLPIADHNIRDLGGIATCDGRKVAPRRLIRGDHLSKCSQDAAQMLTEKLGVKTIIDLRRPSETKRQPDAIFPGVTYCCCPILKDTPKNQKSQKSVAEQMIAQVLAMHGGVINYQTALYRHAVTDPVSLQALREILNRLAAHETGAVYWHCTAGKDRTGMVSALILLVLGVDVQTVRAEYLWTNAIIKEKADSIAAWVAPYAPNDEAVEEIRRWCLVHPDYFDAVMAEIIKRCGSFDRYLKEVLDIDDAYREKLKNLYLISE